MPNGWKPTTSEGLLTHLARETRIQARNPSTRLEPLLQDVIDASEAPDNLPPNDMIGQVDPEDIPVLEPGELPSSVQTSADPDNVVPNSGFERADADGRPTDWTVLWDFISEPDNPLRWDDTPGEAHTGAGRAVVTFTTGWVNNISVYSSAPFPLVAGAQYQGEVRVKSTVAGGHTAIFDLITAPNPESANLFAVGSSATTFGSVTPNAEYQSILGEIVVPPNHHYGKLSLRTEGTTTVQSGEISWDNIMLQQVSEGTVPGGVPWYAHPRTGSFDPMDSVYNASASALHPSRIRVAASKAGRNTNIMCFGDSITAGSGGPGVKSWPAMLLKELERDGCVIKSDGPAFVGVGYSLSTYSPDPRWTFSGTVSQGTWSLWASITNGSWAQFAASRKGTILKILYLHTGGNFTYSIDGGAAVAVTTNGSSTVGTVTVGGLSDATHTIRVTGSSATPAEVLSVDFEANLTGLRVYGAGVVGAGTAQMIDTSFKSAITTGLAVGAPDLVLISLGVNDAMGALDVPTFEQWMREIVQHCKRQGAGVGLIVPPHASVYGMDEWAPYATALYDVADYEGIALLDLTDIWGDYGNSWPSSLWFDGVHPNPNGHANYAHSALRLVY